MSATITFLRRTQKEIEVFGGEVFIDIDGKNVGKLGTSDFSITLAEGAHTIKMYKSHTYDTFIGFAEAQLTLQPEEHLLIRYSSPMVVSQPGNLVVTEYSSMEAEAAARTKEQKIHSDFTAEEQKKEAARQKSNTAAIIIVAVIVVTGIIWGICYASIFSSF